MDILLLIIAGCFLTVAAIALVLDYKLGRATSRNKILQHELSHLETDYLELARELGYYQTTTYNDYR